MIRVVLGALVSAVAMFVIGGLFYASGIQNVAFRNLDNPQAAAVQQVLAANLRDATGTYTVPGTGTAEQTAMYGKGPIATVHYNYHGFPAVAGSALIVGFALNVIAALLIGFGLAAVARAGAAAAQRLAILFAIGAAAYVQLKEPIFFHHDWWHFIYQFLVDALTLAVGGVIVARWFLPREDSTTRPVEAPAAPAYEPPPVSPEA